MKSPCVVAAFSQAEIEELAAEWQRELKIQDWDIQVEVVRSRKMQSPDDGGVNFEEKRREAYIMIRDPRDIAKDRILPYDMEVVLVHELLHCSLAAFTSKEIDDHQDVVQEQQIHSHSQTLVKFKRLAMAKGNY